mmetsp:Transcript_27820/g.75973  ORF Transcript_27820/g.75973 Transcript_27820/m.75973 type:complete len:156 (+) Transcript_27820:263-730(+)
MHATEVTSSQFNFATCSTDGSSFNTLLYSKMLHHQKDGINCWRWLWEPYVKPDIPAASAPCTAPSPHCLADSSTRSFLNLSRNRCSVRARSSFRRGGMIYMLSDIEPTHSEHASCAKPSWALETQSGGRLNSSTGPGSLPCEPNPTLHLHWASES